jgi:Sushi repeat (SCR repeat)
MAAFRKMSHVNGQPRKGRHVNDNHFLAFLAVFCKYLPYPHNGIQQPFIDTAQPYGTIVHYQCLDGRRFEDGQTSKYIECSKNGQWNDTWLTCECMSQTFVNEK